MKRTLTPEQHAASQERRECFRGLVKKVAAMSDAERVHLSAQMPAVVTVEGRVLSPTNQMLCSMQRANLTVVGGFTQWRAQGRAVRKGEHGLMIWFPRTNGEGKGAAADAPETTSSEVRFLIGYVFDVSQTDPNVHERPDNPGEGVRT